MHLTLLRLPQLVDYTMASMWHELPTEAARQAVRAWAQLHAPELQGLTPDMAEAWLRQCRDQQAFPAQLSA